jgi:DNA-binding transcriptional regulator YdaS (Cro superfamily)
LRQNQLPGVLRAFKKAIEIVGSQHKLADAIECSQATLWHWLHSKDGVVPAYAVPKIVVACGNRVTEHELRPDLF